jgi:glutamyl-tRNA synthetase
MSIRTRFAPSPTGYLHIGGVRTALFNWLLTRHEGGQFILRIDDTDTGRNRPEALQPILDGFRWLGITWDEGPEVGGPNGPYFQSQRGSLYLEAAFRLLDGGQAYPAYETAEELKAAREAARAEKRDNIFRGPHRNTPPSECRRLWEERPTVLRLKVPDGQTISITDLIRGRVEWQTNEISDPVIVRADGSPLYNFATVVDDIGMNITHIVRAAEHLSNTAVQVLVYEALGHPLPQFAHVPVVNAPNSSEKLSKRKMQQFITPEVIAKLRAVHAVPAEATDAEIKKREDLNPATVAFYQALGYLPAALVNYLGRLGWSMDDTSEKIPLDVMIARFGLERVNDAPGSFDPDKLAWLAGEYMKELPLEEKVNGVLPFLVRAGLIQDPIGDVVRHKVRQIVEATGDRLRTFSDILTHAATFLKKDPEYDPKAVDKKLKKPEAVELLTGFRAVLADAQTFEPAPLEQLLTSYCEQRGAKKNVLVHALRVAVTGTEVGLGLYETLVILGRAETLRRIDLGLKLAGQPS